MAFYFDSHAHYDDNRFDADREAVIAALREAGVRAVMNSASDLESSRAALALAKRYPFFRASAGVHPHEAKTLDAAALGEVARLCREPEVVALGEIGLDYYYNRSEREVQREAFRRQLALARKLDLPVVIHSRDAAQDTLEIVREYRPRGVVHCFSYSAEQAREYAELGMYLGFTGVVTFPNAKKPLEAAAAVPLDRILIETDCPYLAPVPYRGRRCDSTMLHATADALAAAKGISRDVLLRAAWENAIRVYEITGWQEE